MRLHIPTLGPGCIDTFVVNRVGNYRSKVQISCMSGPQDRYGNIQLIWKRKTGWFCWVLGTRHPSVFLERV
ncbi:MAG: hypothetical protein AAB445_01475 [Patescibacteria group bacterium]